MDRQMHRKRQSQLLALGFMYIPVYTIPALIPVIITGIRARIVYIIIAGIRAGIVYT
jgi:hypothetical protein